MTDGIYFTCNTSTSRTRELLVVQCCIFASRHGKPRKFAKKNFWSFYVVRASLPIASSFHSLNILIHQRPSYKSRQLLNCLVRVVRPNLQLYSPSTVMFARQVLRATQRRCFSASAKQVSPLSNHVLNRSNLGLSRRLRLSY